MWYETLIEKTFLLGFRYVIWNISRKDISVSLDMWYETLTEKTFLVGLDIWYETLLERYFS